MALKRGSGDNVFSAVFRTRNYSQNDKFAPLTLVRPGVQETARTSLTGVPNETYVKLIEETGANTYNADFLVPAGSIIRDVFVYAQAAWTAATSATLNVGDYAWTNSAVGAAVDADGFFAAVNLKATDLLVNESISFAAAGAKGGAYHVGTATHWTNIYSTTARVIRFNVVSIGAGTAGRTLVGVTFAQVAEVLDTINS